MAQIDLLYSIFELHLFNALVEDETADEFVESVVKEYVKRVSKSGTILPEHRQQVETDLREEVLEMMRKKTYGHFNLKEFRKANGVKPPPTVTPPKGRQPRGIRRSC